ncbi:hypothetical protein HZY83_07910 [Gemella sp. GH3]|uniref:CAP domain-containing protein n=1 Tax=unclassified Gemella TaxID=2624949 RepID=UPI0015D083F1|nr:MULTISPECIES: CAP domain-containing protein [unclassified Gemella]MBF0714594.1 hypothetical protein [Gemella sp. GH3.1]NYS51546.1 hypothetical protein [Gemella sp. GH3]
MKRTLKITSGLLASTILLSGYNGEKITVAAGVETVNVETANPNVKAQLIEKDGKNYVVVTATKDVNNLSVRAKASNNQTFVFKQASLKAGESVSFELEIVAEKTEKQKQLPKTSVVRETLKLDGFVKKYKLETTISYDVEVPETVEQPKINKKEEVKPEVSNEITTPVEPSAAPVVENKEEAKTEDKHEVEAPKEEPAVEPVQEAPKNETPVTEEAPKEEVKPAPAVVTEEDKVSETVNVNKVSNEVKVASTTAVASPLRSVQPAVQVAKPVVTAPQTTVQGTDEATVAAQVFQQLNAHRLANGLPALTVNNALLAGAEVRANELATKVKSGVPSGMGLHTRLNGSSWITAFSGLGARGENLAYSMYGAQGMMNFWKNSASHNAAMLNKNYTSVAIKVVKVGNNYYGVQIFA